MRVWNAGDIQLVERPSPVTLGPGEWKYVEASLKVRSTEASVVFGLVTFESKQRGRRFLLLTEQQVNSLEFVEPHWIDEQTFRGKWAEFEWENKVLISAPPVYVHRRRPSQPAGSFLFASCPKSLRAVCICRDAVSFLKELLRHTHMTVVGSKRAKASLRKRSLQTLKGHPSKRAVEEAEEDAFVKESLEGAPQLQALARQSSVFAVNLYSRSVFGGLEATALLFFRGVEWWYCAAF